MCTLFVTVFSRKIPLCVCKSFVALLKAFLVPAVLKTFLESCIFLLLNLQSTLGLL